ncbi:MAG: DUF1549 domain-containing protein [Verrucomicrobiota bacterium]
MPPLSRPIVFAAVCSLMLRGGLATATEAFAFFETEVRPILVANCYQCHSEEAGKRKGGLWLDRKEGWAIGGDGGPALKPGDLDRSKLVHAIRYTDPALQMPPKSKLSADEVATLEKWISIGAPDPRTEAMAGAVRKDEIDYDLARQGWAYRGRQEVSLPEVRKTEWVRTEVDRFVLAALEEQELRPAAEANSEALLRRLYFDLTGLPPTREELAAFLESPDESTYARVVDDLLSRPAFGEKWGRHWLDVVRYADSNGGDRNFTFYQAWRYRNWVIDWFNRDGNYYDFVRMQLAGDVLPFETAVQRSEQLIASTFLTLGPKMLTERDKEKLWMDTVDEQIDTMGQAFLGLTLGCARCHDHKFDPVSQEDYYAVAGIFRSTDVVTGTRNGCVNVASWVEQALPVGGEKEAELREKVDRIELAMRLVVEKTYMKKAGGKMTLDDLPLAGVIYDEADAELIGNWKSSTYSDNRFGAEYVHDDKKNKGEKKAIFRGSLPESGEYEVRMAYSAHAGRDRRVPVRIVARDGRHQVFVDETKRPSVGGLFEPLGRFQFEKGGKCEVVISTEGTSGYVIVDAVQLIAVEDIEREAKAIAASKVGEADPLMSMSEGDLKKELKKMLDSSKNEALVMAPRDGKRPGDIHLRVRGEVGQLGEKVQRGFLQVLHEGKAPDIPDGRSGRVELADWMIGHDNVLLDRVMVNRIWYHLFNQGIVETVDNFGRLGSGPSNPELLEYLANSFRESGGSVKEMVRELVLSRSYRLSSEGSAELVEADPENLLFGRQNRRRLTAEELRDGLLFVGGILDRTPGEATANGYGDDLDEPISYVKSKQRTVYLPIARNNLAPELVVFDAANPDLVSGQRAETTVPTQALYLLNSDFVRTQAKALGEAALKASEKPGQEVDWLYQTLLGRSPNPVERDRSLGFIADLSGGSEAPEPIAIACGELAHVLIASAEFFYLD